MPRFEAKRPGEERRRLLGEALGASGSWVLSGSVCGWGDVFIPRFSLVLFLWIPHEIRMRRLYPREVARYGEAAIAAGGERHEAHKAFMAWAASYDEGDTTMRSRRQQEGWLGQVCCPVVRLEGEMSTVEQVVVVQSFLAAR